MAMIIDVSNYARTLELKRSGMVNESIMTRDDLAEAAAAPQTPQEKLNLLLASRISGPYMTHWKMLENEIIKHVNQDTYTKDRFEGTYTVTFAKNNQPFVTVHWKVDPKTGNVDYWPLNNPASAAPGAKPEPYVLFK